MRRLSNVGPLPGSGEVRWGPAYAHKTHAFSVSEAWAREARCALGKLVGCKFLVDFACGTGTMARYVPEVLGDVDYAGVDVNSAALEIARGLYPALPFSESIMAFERPDAVICVHALPQFENPHAVLAELWERLTPGGKIVLTLHNDLHRWLWKVPNLFTGYKSDPTIACQYRLGSLRTLMRDAGFQEIEVGRMPDKLWHRVLPWLSPRLIYVGRKPELS